MNGSPQTESVRPLDVYVGNGCALPALIADVPRSTPAIRSAFVAGIEDDWYSCRTDVRLEEARSEAIATLSVMLGAPVLARSGAVPQTGPRD